MVGEKGEGSPWRFTLKVWPVVTIVAMSLCYLTQLVAGWFGIALPEQANIELIRKMFGNPRALMINIPLVILILPALEELAFRGLLFRLPVWLASRLTTSRFAVFFFAAASSVAFSAAHYLKQPFPDNAFIALFVIGIAQCWLLQRTRRFLCVMLNHALFNLANLLLLLVIPA